MIKNTQTASLFFIRFLYILEALLDLKENSLLEQSLNSLLERCKKRTTQAQFLT